MTELEYQYMITVKDDISDKSSQKLVESELSTEEIEERQNIWAELNLHSRKFLIITE